MLVPISWLKEYVAGAGGERNAAELAERMVMSGSNIESVRAIGEEVEGVVIGKLLEVKPHTDSDHLVVCQVDVASAADGILQIVTGAPNVKTGDFVPVALHGSSLPGGIKIKKGKLRGEASEGMLCSAQELGFDEKVVPISSKDGIWILPKEFWKDEYLGRDALEVLGLVGEVVIDFEITPNRPDCLSIFGMAREYAAVYGLELKAPETLAPDAAGVGGKSAADAVKVRVDAPELCGRYIARAISDVKIADSPWFIQKSLMLAGMRPISNVVDITNYVLLELGHPIHAFDAREITGGEIRVQPAKNGEKFTTLDGEERELDENALLIKDGARGVAIAGVMGGLNSGIREDTKDVIIEAASFSADSVRKTSKRLGLRTEASSRYEKGVPAELSRIASDRVCELIRLIGAGEVLDGEVDVYNAPAEKKPIVARVARINALLRLALSAEEMAKLLERLGIETEISGEELVCKPPFVRLDLTEEVDLAEEIARLYGYDKHDSLLYEDATVASLPKSWRVRSLVREALVGAGFFETQSYSFTLPSYAGEGSLKLLNPLGEDTSAMRTTLLPGMLESLARNYNHGSRDAFLFEIGNTFFAKAEGELPDERLSLCAGFFKREGANAPYRSGGEADFFLLKGVLERVFAKLGPRGALALEAETSEKAWHPGRCAKAFLQRKDGEKTLLGLLGEVHPNIRESFGLSERVFAFELNFDALAEHALAEKAYSPLPRFPAATRDLALVADEDVAVGSLKKIIKEKGGRKLETVQLFDVYRGGQIPEGKKSLAFSLAFRAADRTLTDEEVDGAVARILAAIKQETGATLRA